MKSLKSWEQLKYLIKNLLQAMSAEKQTNFPWCISKWVNKHNNETSS